MGHWRINGVPCCLSKWTGSELDKRGNRGPQSTQMTCACDEGSFKIQADYIRTVFQGEDLECTWHEESCPGDSYWGLIVRDNRMKVLTEWAHAHLPGYYLDENKSGDELFVLRLSSTEKVLYVARVPFEGWVLLRPNALSSSLDQDALNKAGRE